MIIAADISIQLSKLGYEIIGISTHAEDALRIIEKNRPDVILMDIILNGKMNGIDAARLVLERYQIPVIFLTSNTDDATFNRALSTKPFAFIAKPFQKIDLERTLKMTFQRIVVEQESEPLPEKSDHVSAMDDRLFIRHKDQMVKVAFSEILFAEADRSYCKLHTKKILICSLFPFETWKLNYLWKILYVLTVPSWSTWKRLMRLVNTMNS